MGLVKTWVDPFGHPTVRVHDGLVAVVRDDLLPYGTKARAISAVLHQPEYRDVKTLVYVAPRVGWAAQSLAAVGRQLGKRVVLFCPAAKQPSDHQLRAHALGAELRFYRVAAMPVLQGEAKAWASQQRNAAFFPLGVAVPAAVAGLAKVAIGLKLRPKHVWCAASTGVLTRALQVAWPNAEHHVVAVSRNLKDGERGTATVFSCPHPFYRPCDVQPPFPSVPTYDAKAWERMMDVGVPGSLFWNVAGEHPWIRPTNQPLSNRAWGDRGDLRHE